jgi:hypothetical protein
MDTATLYDEIVKTYPRTVNIGIGADINNETLEEFVHPSKIIAIAEITARHTGVSKADFIGRFANTTLNIPNIIETFEITHQTDDMHDKKAMDIMLNKQIATCNEHVLQKLRITITPADFQPFKWAPLIDHITFVKMTSTPFRGRLYAQVFNTSDLPSLLTEPLTMNTLAAFEGLQPDVGFSIFQKIPLNILLCTMHNNGLIGEYRLDLALDQPQVPLYSALYIIMISIVTSSDPVTICIIKRAMSANMKCITDVPIINSNAAGVPIGIQKLISTLNKCWQEPEAPRPKKDHTDVTIANIKDYIEKATATCEYREAIAEIDIESIEKRTPPSAILKNAITTPERWFPGLTAYPLDEKSRYDVWFHVFKHLYKTSPTVATILDAHIPRATDLFGTE